MQPHDEIFMAFIRPQDRDRMFGINVKSIYIFGVHNVNIIEPNRTKKVLTVAQTCSTIDTLAKRTSRFSCQPVFIDKSKKEKQRKKKEGKKMVCPITTARIIIFVPSILQNESISAGFS